MRPKHSELTPSHPLFDITNISNRRRTRGRVARLSPAKTAVLWLLLAASYWVAAKAGLALAFVNASTTAVWPPTGIALAAVLVFGPRAWPGIFLGAFLANVTTAGSVATSLMIAAGNSAEALLGGYLVTRFAAGLAAFHQGKHIFRFVLLAGVLSPIVSATVGVTSLSVSGFSQWSAYSSLWLTWWLGDATGAIMVAPLLLLWYDDPRLDWSGPQRRELFLQLLSLIGIAWVVFVATAYPVGFLCLPLCVWVGFRFGAREAATATGLLAAIAIWGTLQGQGAFSGWPPNDALMLLQAFMAVTTVIGISVGAAASGQRLAQDHLREFNRDLEQRVRTRTGELQSALDRVGITESRLAEAQHVAHIGSWEWTVGDDHVWWSDELCRIFGVDGDAHPVTYQRFIEAVQPGDRQRVSQTLQRALTDQQPFAFEHRLQHAERGVRILQVQGHVVCDTVARPLRMLGTGQDITDRKRLEAQYQQAQKMEAIGLLAGGVAHDFNNMLTIILGYTDMVLSQIGPDKPISADLLAIREAGEGAASLTRQLLAFSRKQVFQLVAVDLNNIVSAVEQLLRHSLGDNIQIVTTLAPNLGSVQADATGLQQVVMNLAINARDAMANGGTLTIETANVDLTTASASSPPDVAPGRYIRLAVSDTGQGMDEATQARIFEPFFTTKDLGRGTGLGLATVYGIVNQLGGKISLESTLGHGTTFHLYFPESHQRVEAPVASAVAGLNLVGAETVVLVEDDDKVRDFASTVLQRHGYHVHVAETPARALLLAEQLEDPIHLLLTDMSMPGLNGAELAVRFSAKRPETAILFMSGYAEHVMRHSGLSREAFELLEKPFTSRVLLQKVRDVLDAADVRLRVRAEEATAPEVGDIA